MADAALGAEQHPVAHIEVPTRSRILLGARNDCTISDVRGESLSKHGGMLTRKRHMPTIHVAPRQPSFCAELTRCRCSGSLSAAVSSPCFLISRLFRQKTLKPGRWSSSLMAASCRGRLLITHHVKRTRPDRQTDMLKILPVD